MISYRKLLELCEKKGINSYTFKKNKMMSQGTWMAIRRNENVSLKIINDLCKLLDVQPGDILEYIPDEEE